MKKLLSVALVSVCLVSCSKQKITELTIELGNVETQIAKVKSQIKDEQQTVLNLNREIESFYTKIASLNKEIAEKQNKIEQLEVKIQKKKEDAAKPKKQSKPKGRKANEAGPNDKRYRIENGMVKY